MHWLLDLAEGGHCTSRFVHARSLMNARQLKLRLKSQPSGIRLVEHCTKTPVRGRKIAFLGLPCGGR
jgi:hypothetical protein